MNNVYLYTFLINGYIKNIICDEKDINFILAMHFPDSDIYVRNIEKYNNTYTLCDKCLYNNECISCLNTKIKQIY